MTHDSLTHAYRNALYELDLPDGERVVLRVDARCEALQQWLASHGHSCAALLTAHNPGSAPRDALFNDEAQRKLQAIIHARGLRFLTGRNLDPKEEWPPEDSLLVADLSLAQTRALALQFGQRAFLWCDASAIARLHGTRQA